MKKQLNSSSEKIMKNILLVEPEFPIATKSKNHKNILPIGLLKIASYLNSRGNKVKLIRGAPKDLEKLQAIIEFNPREIWITSLFTYWAEYVRDTVSFYKNLFPNAKIIVGGVYASLFPKDEVKEYTRCDEVYQGVMEEAEKFLPDYSLVDVDYQIVHASRGCSRKCDFCGTWKIENKFTYKDSIKNEIICPKIVFYDNNLLQNPKIESILNELVKLKEEKKIKWCESQSGFDGRLLLEKPRIGILLRKAGFRYPRIAWDGSYGDYTKIKQQIDILIESGYSSKEIFIFVLYNWDIPFQEMEKKRLKCFEWGVQIADCRFRPLDQLFDYYNGRKKGQTNSDYHIHETTGWTDYLVKLYRRNIREQNICVRYGFPLYSRAFETKSIGKEIRRQLKLLPTIDEKIRFLENRNIEYWIPDRPRKDAPYTQKETFNYALCSSK